MAVSGSFDYNNTVTEIIDDALEYAGLRDRIQTTAPDVAQTCIKTLNYMLKYWNAGPIGLWLIDEIAIFMQNDTTAYEIYPSGTHASTSYVKTELSADASSGASSISIDSATGVGDTFDRNGIITATTPSGSGSITFDGALVTGTTAYLSSERKVLIYSDGNDSGVSFTVNGTNHAGTTVSESITGPNATTVYSSNEYFTVTSITISGAGTGNIEIGQVGDHLGIELNSGSVQWTNITGTPSTTVSLITTLTGAAATDNHIYTYTSRAQKPLQILEARLYMSSGTEYPLRIISRDEHQRLSDKNSEGRPVSIYPDVRIDRMKINVWPEPENVQDYIKLSARRRIDDVDGLTENVSFPPEWLLVLSTNLAYWVAPKFGIGGEKLQILKALASDSFNGLLLADQENTSVFIEPDYR